MRRHPLRRCWVGALALGIALAGTTTTAGTAFAGTRAQPVRQQPVEQEDVGVVTLNLLHGVFCPADSNGCLAPDRVELLERQLEDAGCPEVVGLQEINSKLYKLIKRTRAGFCDGRYKLVFPPPTGIDHELVLTTLKVRSTKVEKLVGQFRTASRVVLRSPIGPLVVVVTHQDGDPDASEPPVGCRKTCPPVCEPGSPLLACQTTVAVDLAESVGDDGAVRVLMGDFNVTPASARYRTLIDGGWVDSYLAAGNPECDPANGFGCTGGRDDKTVEALTDPALQESERIDFLFVKSPERCVVAFDSGDDADGDSLGTRLFAGEPTTDGPGGLAWPSDHIGVAADLSCS